MGKKDKTGKKNKKNKKIRLYIAGGVLALVALIILWGTAPLQGTMHVGICRTFAELRLQYPDTMKTTATEIFEREQRIYYTYLDGFGHHNSDRIDCRFRYPFGSPNLVLDKVAINRAPVPQKDVDRFNLTLPAIVAAQPDLTIPFPPSDDIKKLRVTH